MQYFTVVFVFHAGNCIRWQDRQQQTSALTSVLKLPQNEVMQRRSFFAILAAPFLPVARLFAAKDAPVIGTMDVSFNGEPRKTVTIYRKGPGRAYCSDRRIGVELHARGNIFLQSSTGQRFTLYAEVERTHTEERMHF